MASSANVAKRRQAAGELWLRGCSLAKIAAALDVSIRTIRTDIDAVRDQLQQDRVAELERRRDRSVAVLRTVQREAWTLFARLDDASSSKIGALNTISTAEERIAKLEQTLGADISVQQTTNVGMSQAEWSAIQAKIVAALSAFPAAQLAVADALAPLEEFRARLN